MEINFPEKYFPASRETVIRREIYGIKQQDGETLSEYWKRFNKFCVSCDGCGGIVSVCFDIGDWLGRRYHEL